MDSRISDPLIELYLYLSIRIRVRKVIKTLNCPAIEFCFNNNNAYGVYSAVDIVKKGEVSQVHSAG